PSGNTADAKVDTSAPSVAPVASTIAYRSSSSLSQAAATSIALSVPAGTQQNDVMLAQIDTKGSSGAVPAITAPAGWTLIRNDASGGAFQQALYSHVATSSEPASYTWTLSLSVAASGGIASYSGVDTTTPVDVSGGAASLSI